MYKILFILFFINFSIYADSFYDAIPMGDGKNYLCVGDSNFNIYTAKFTKNGYSVLNSKKLLNLQKKKQKNLTNQINQNIGNTPKLKSKRKKIKLLIKDINLCQKKELITQVLFPCSKIDGSVRSNKSPIILGSKCSDNKTAVVPLVMLDVNANILGTCTGTIISKKQVLTAAHCLFSQVRGVLSKGLNEGESYYINPKYRGTFDGLYDIAIINFSNEFDRKPVELNGTGYLHKNLSAETALIAGYGKDESGVSTLEKGYYKAGKTVIVNQTPSGIYALFNRYDDYLDANTCQGDSGGPLYVRRMSKWVLTGVTSFGDADCGVNGGYSDSYYADLTNTANVSFIKQIAPSAKFVR